MAATWKKIVFSGSAPQFTTIELGHASDTTISRTGSGDIAVEGNAIYRAGGTDIPVTDGGTGRSTGTTAYALVATGTTATGAQQTLANGATTEVLVGGGASALPVWTTATGSGAPVRATSPTLTSIELGHPSDTTLSRTGAGDIAVEGNAIYRAGGTDVPVTDGGTGASTLTDHGILLGSGTAAVTPLGAATNGQLPIGSTGADPVLAAITPGDGIDVTNAAGAITVAVDIKANGGLVIDTTELTVNLGASAITGTLAVGDGGTGSATAQAAINTLTAVSAATNEHVLTKDTTTGNAIFKAIGSPTTWSSVSSANYTAAPASTSTITMTADLTGSILVGQSLKYTIGGVVYYGRVAIIAANLLTINGAPLSGNVSDLYFGGGTIRQAQIVIPGAYEDATNTALIASDLKSSLIWSLPKSYCVAFAVYSNTHDTGTHGQASVRINGTELCTTAGGLTIAADATWYASVVDIDVTAYDVNPGEAIEVTSVKAGNGDASDLTVKMIIVTP